MLGQCRPRDERLRRGELLFRDLQRRGGCFDGRLCMLQLFIGERPESGNPVRRARSSRARSRSA